MDYKEHLKEKMKDPGFKREYEALAHEFDAFDVNEKVKQGLNDVRRMKERKIKPRRSKGFSVSYSIIPTPTFRKDVKNP